MERRVSTRASDPPAIMCGETDVPLLGNGLGEERHGGSGGNHFIRYWKRNDATVAFTSHTAVTVQSHFFVGCIVVLHVDGMVHVREANGEKERRPGGQKGRKGAAKKCFGPDLRAAT